MNRRTRRGGVLLGFLIVAGPSALGAGVYIGPAVCSDSSDCQPLAFVSDPANTVPPFAVTHPPSYDGSGGVISIDVCVLPGSEIFRGPAMRAIQTWNALLATTQNCRNCKVWEDSPENLTGANAETTILHELGHCPLGLDHPERNWDSQPDGIWELTSFTRSWGVANPPSAIDVGPDFIRGTFDDIQLAPGGVPQSVHWFRIIDNNPFAIDATVIDVDTYSRSVVADLPAGHGWAANGNRRVGETLGLMDTQVVMYGRQSQEEVKTSLTADDVNMVKMAMTGKDFQAGTADDYTIQLSFVDNCNNVDVLISFTDLADPTTLGFCEVGVDYSFPQNPLLTRHVSLVPIGAGEPLVILLNQTIDWDIGDTVFSDGFESGNFSAWSSVVP